MRSRLLNTLIIAIFLLSIAAPLVPIVAPITKVAHAGSSVTVWANATRVTYGATVEVVVTVPNATTSTYKVNITVNGVLNTVEFERNGTTENYIGYLTINNDGTVTYTSLSGYTSQVLNGQLTADGQTIVISADGTWTIYFYKTLKLIIEGREYPANSGVFWVPRICNCTVGSVNPYYAYNPWEWYFLAPAATPGEQYNVSIEIDDVNGNPVAGPETIVFNATTKGGMTVLIPANDTEAEKITDLLMTASENVLPWYIMGNNFDDIVREGDFLTISATVLGIAGGTQTTSAQLRIFVSIAEIYTEPETLSLNHPDFTVYVADADANFNTLAQETYPYQIDIEGNTYTLTETGKNTGVFEVSLNLLTSGLYPTIFNENDNKLEWNMQEIRIDNTTTTFYCNRSGTFTIQYHDATVKAVEASVVLRQATQCCPVLKLTLQVDDQDILMGYPSTIPVATVKVDAGMYLTNVTANYVYYDGSSMTITDVPAIMFSLYLVGVNETNGTMAVPLEATNSFTLSFYQVGSNMIQAQIPLDQVNWKDANNQLVSSGYNPKYIEVVYYDLFTTSLEIKKIELKVPIQKVDMELDRYELPVAARLHYTGTISDYYTDVDGPAYQVVHITIYDEGANKNCCGVDTIGAGNITLTLSKYNSVVGATVLEASDTAMLAIPLKERLDNGSYLSTNIGTCYIEVTDLTETGVNTGEFTGELYIWSEITTSAGTFIIPGCPSPWLDGATLTLHYTSPAVGYAERTITFHVKDASLSVSPTGEVKFGTEVTVTVNDPDANLDNQVNESVIARLGLYCPMTGRIIGEQYIWLHAVAANSTTYEGSFVVDTHYAQPCTRLQIFYIDPTPYDAGSLSFADQLLKEAWVDNGKSPVDWLLYFSSNYVPTESPAAGVNAVSFAPAAKAVHSETISVVPEVGKVEVYYDVPVLGIGWINVTNKVVPAFGNIGIKIVVIDSDQNKDATAIDYINKNLVIISFGDTKVTVPANLVETDVSTGEFEITMTLNDILNLLGVKLSDVVNKTITITYHDPTATCQVGVCGAGAKDVSVSFKVIDLTGNISIVDTATGEAKDSYNCYCLATNTPGDSIDLSVADPSLLQYVANGSISFDDFFSVYNVKQATETPAVHSIGNLTYDHYYNVTVDGVPIPVPVFIVTNIKLLCSQFSGMTGNYIVAPPMTMLKIVYHDPFGTNGEPVDVSKEVGIGFAAVTKPEDTATINTTAIDVRVYRNGTYVATTVVMQGEPVTIEAPISYNPLAASMYAGQTFQVLYLVTDSSGHVYAFGYVPVSVSQSGFITVPLQISSLVTQGLQPGTYKVVIMVVNNLTDLVSLSKPVEVTITVQAA